MRKIDSKVVSLSGISAALAIIFILFAIYIPNVKIACYVIASLSISLPLVKKSIIGAVLSYVASSIISFLLASINVLPFIIFFGLYSIIEYVLDFVLYQREKLNKTFKIILIIIIKIAYYFAAFFAMFYLMKIAISDFALFGITWTLPLLLFAGFVFFAIYDYLYRKAYIMMEKVILKRIG